MAAQTQILRTTVVYPISKLSAISAINQNSLIELSIKTDVDRWESRQTTVSDFGNFIITSHAIFNNLYDLYNTSPDDITFTKPTYFNRRPYIRHITGDTTIDSITAELNSIPIVDNNLVTLYDVKQYISTTGIAVQAVGKNSRYRHYVESRHMWQNADKPTVVSNDEYMQPIYDSDNCIKFTSKTIADGAVAGYATSAIIAEKDMMVNVVANILLNQTYDSLVNNAPTPYYNYNSTHWLALIINGGAAGTYNVPIVGTVSQFTDIVNVLVLSSNITYAVAQVKITMPIAKGTEFYLFTPASINTTTNITAAIHTHNKFKRSLFAGVNEAAVFYFDNDFATA